MKEFVVVNKKPYGVDLEVLYDFPDVYCGPQEINEALEKINETYHMDELSHETMYAVALGSYGEILGTYHISIGENDCETFMRHIGMFLLLIGAKKFTVIHNHESALAAYPSQEDKWCESSMYGIGNLIDVEYLGGYILVDGGFVDIDMEEWFSFEEEEE